jgi:arylsulfatase A-like enzyme
MDQFAADSVVFKNASSAAPWTLPSVVSLMTGIPPFAHRVSRPKDGLPDEFPTLAEYMRDAGYVTAAVTENYNLQPKCNIHKGFQEFAHFPKLWPWQGDAAGRYFLRLVFPAKYHRGGTEVVTQSAQKWLNKNRDTDYFFWVHYLDPHVPYRPPPRLLPGTRPPERLGTSFDLQEAVRGGMFLTAEQRTWIKQLYLAEVQFVDENIGLLLNTLKQLGLYDDSLIVLTSDHGEEFWEHGRYEHGHSAYQEVISVPLIIKLPNSTATGTVATRVSNQFVMPTILELCGIDDHSRCYSAPSLAPRWSGKGSSETHNILLSSGALFYEDLEAVLFDNHKFIRFVSSEREELYNLTSDPHETRSIHASAAEMADQGRHTLEEQRRLFSKVRDCYSPIEREARAPGAELIRRLRSLGYLK